MNSIAVEQNSSMLHRVARTAIPVLALLGAGISAYLTYVHFTWVEPVCLSGMDCNSVLFSPYAELFGIPIAGLGLLLYVCLLLTSVLLYARQYYSVFLGALGIFTISFSGVLFSLYLLYLEVFKIHAFCSWCIGSALIILGIFLLGIINLRPKSRFWHNHDRDYSHHNLTGRILVFPKPVDIVNSWHSMNRSSEA